ncbi:hypothetical protein [Chitinophaga flava]|uniref:Uncharacterized protein n=1 Tax=Chitinophaga flava TaxID=2259036 RepID=A0A365Y4A1_9BACT|nr:hypothetical protein [Chitinophaga flava]RBL93329.1 hypothetical protein DF182_12445 [Chitinophaga flava]
MKPKVIAINLLLLATWTYILMSFVTMHKTEVWLLDTNPYYGTTLWVLYFLSLFYAYFFVTRNIFLNLLITSLLFMVSFFIAFESVEVLMNYLIKMDKGKTPLRWTFKYRFLDIAIINVLLLVLLEVIRKFIPAKWRTK